MRRGQGGTQPHVCCRCGRLSAVRPRGEAPTSPDLVCDSLLALGNLSLMPCYILLEHRDTVTQLSLA